jgi:hypothetical protein
MDGQTERCAHCGTPATEGRFCTNCGAELGTEPTNPRVLPSPTDTAERAYDLPAYAVGQTPTAPPPPHTYATPAGPAYLAPGPAAPRGPGPGLWMAVVAAMVVVLLLGGFLLLHGGGSTDDATGPATPIVPQTSRSAGSPTSPSSPSGAGPSSSPTAPVTGPPTDVAGFAQASAPRHAPSGVDFDGRPVSYVAGNLVDGRNDTCWRTPGDATGTELTFRLDQPTRISRVGLVNGYAKTAYSGGRAFDWYHGNRRVLAVEWLFDDGSRVSQRLVDERDLQQVAVKPVTTSVVRLRITAVSAPGKGRAARNDTAISEVLLLGRTA